MRCPDALAALACALTWRAPDALGFDLLMATAPLYFIELPLAIGFAFADAWRVPGEFLDTRRKLRPIVIPTLLLGGLYWMLFDIAGLIAIGWLGGLSPWRLLREGEDRRPPPTGRWLVMKPRENGTEHWLTRTRPTRSVLGPDAWIVPCAHDQFLPGVTIFVWVGLMLLLGSGVEIPPLGATIAYAQSVGRTLTPIGTEVPAHFALSAGAALFAARTISHFDDVGEPPLSDITLENDEVLREVIDKVKGRKPSKRKTRRR